MAEDPGAIREEIDATRAELADTIEALGHKADVKGRVSDAVASGRESVVVGTHALKERVSDALPDAVAAPSSAGVVDSASGAGRRAWASRGIPLTLVVGVVALVVWRGLRRTRHNASLGDES